MFGKRSRHFRLFSDFHTLRLACDHEKVEIISCLAQMTLLPLNHQRLLHNTLNLQLKLLYHKIHFFHALSANLPTKETFTQLLNNQKLKPTQDQTGNFPNLV